jgi:hypothetical protein
LLDQARLEPIDIGVGEEFVDALVGRDVLHEDVNMNNYPKYFNQLILCNSAR